MRETKKNLNTNSPNTETMTSYWQKILLGVAGGILITGGLWGFTVLEGDTKFLMLIPIALGISSIFYARYG